MRHQKGFTLIELMIVIAFFGIIAAVIFGGISANNYVETKASMGTEGGTIEEPQTYTLKCTSMDGMTVLTESSVPGERWRFEGGVYVTNDEYGNPRTIPVPAGSKCSVKVG